VGVELRLWVATGLPQFSRSRWQALHLFLVGIAPRKLGPKKDTVCLPIFIDNSTGEPVFDDNPKAGNRG